MLSKYELEEIIKAWPDGMVYVASGKS